MHGFIFVSNIMSYNLINLTTNKLSRLNYVDWKRNLDIVLTSNELKCVTQELTPSPPNEHSIQEQKDNYHSL